LYFIILMSDEEEKNEKNEKNEKRTTMSYVLTLFIINVFYIVILFALTFIKHSGENSSDTSLLPILIGLLKKEKIWVVIYLVVVFFTLKLINDLEVQKYGNTLDPLWLTIHPMVLVLLPIVYLLHFTEKVSEEMKRPFEATIGHFIIQFLPDYKEVSKEIKGEGAKDFKDDVEKKANNLAHNVKMRKFNLKGIQEYLDKSKNDSNNELKEKAEKVYKLRAYISEFIWITLAGIIVSNITTLSLLNS